MEDALDPDGALVARIAAGDQAAVRDLVGRHIGSLTSVARRMMGTQEDAEEVVQEVFLKVWARAKDWEPGRARFSTWMHRVAINGCYDRLRRKRESAIDEVPERADDAPDPEDNAISSDVSASVDAALQALPDRQRAALVMCHYQGHSQTEAAEALEVSVEAVESLLARGRRTLRERLKGLAREHGIGAAQARGTRSPQQTGVEHER